MKDFQLTYKAINLPTGHKSNRKLVFQLTYNKSNFPTRLSTTRHKSNRKLDFQLIYKTSNLPTRHKSNRIRGLRLTYKTFNLHTRLSTNYYTNIQPQSRSEGFALTGYAIPGCVEDGTRMLWENSSVVVAVIVTRSF